MRPSNTDRPSMHDVARVAGVSAATVSKMLRGVKTIKPASVKRIRAAIDELGYRVDPLAADMRRSRRAIIGLVVPDLENEFFGAIASRLELMAEAAGYSLSIASSHESQEREEQLIERMGDWRVAGTILAPVRSERGLGATKMYDLGMKGVLIDRVDYSENYSAVSVDNGGASASVCRAFGDLGHKHVLIIGPSDISKNVRSRISGFCHEAARLFPDMKVDTLISDGGTAALRERVAEQLRSQKPTAVFSVFQKGTLVALTEFRSQGLRCPEDIDLIGFDDAEWMQVTDPTVSAVVQPVERLATQAFETLMADLDEKSDGVTRLYLEDCLLALRGSVSHPKKLRLAAENRAL